MVDRYSHHIAVPNVADAVQSREDLHCIHAITHSLQLDIFREFLEFLLVLPLCGVQIE